MAGLFLSYKSEDRPSVQRLVDALEADGLDVWWDAQIGGGTAWRQTIQTELDAASCVLVCWTHSSVGPQGHFVHDEATRAQRRGVYLPIRLDPVDLPLGFGETQALSLIGWKGDRADARYQAVLATTRSVMSGVPLGRPAVSSVVPARTAVPRRAFVLGSGLLGTAVVAGGSWLLLRPEVAKANSIAVLPFANLSGNPALAYISDGIAEELRSALSRIAGLKVAARTSSEKMRDADIAEVAKKLGVAHVLMGSVRHGPGTIRVTAQLLAADSGVEQWSSLYERPDADVLVVQISIAESVANALSLSFGRAAKMLGGTRNPVAYDAYLRAAAIQQGNIASLRQCLAALDAAVAADPDFAAAHASRSLKLTDLARNVPQAEADQDFAMADAAARRAVALEPALPIAYTALGWISESRLDLRGADSAYHHAMALSGTSAQTKAMASMFYGMIGREDAALELADEAVELDPLNPARQEKRIMVMCLARRPDAAMNAITAYDSANPNDPLDLRFRATALLLARRPRDALGALAKLPGEDWEKDTLDVVAFAQVGDRAGADRSLAVLKAADDGSMAFQFATAYAARGEADLAFAQLDKCVVTRDPGLIWLRVEPAFDGLRGDPRYAAIEKQIGFPKV